MPDTIFCIRRCHDGNASTRGRLDDHHKEAHVVRFGATGIDRVLLRSNSHDPHLHHKANTIGSGNAPIDVHFTSNSLPITRGRSSNSDSGARQRKNGIEKISR